MWNVWDTLFQCVSVSCAQDKTGRAGHTYIPVSQRGGETARFNLIFRRVSKNLAQLDKIVGFARNLEILLHSYAALMLLMDFK